MSECAPDCTLYAGNTAPFIFEVTDCNGDIVILTGATLLEMTFQRPDGTKEIRVDCTLVTDGSDGLYQFQPSSSTFLNPGGRWYRQGRVILASGQEHPTSQVTFVVEETL